MKFGFIILMVVINVACRDGHATETLKTTPEYCLFITVDGLDRDYVARGDAPALLSYQTAGTSMPDSINVYPTLTTPNMTSLLTGAYPITTTIGANTVFLKEEQRAVGAPRFNKAVTIAEVFQKAGHPTAAVQHFMLENRGAQRYNHIKEGTSTDITTQALAFLREKPTPKLLAVLYQSLDKQGHRYGAQSITVSQECRQTDAEIKKLVDAYKELGILDRTVIAITSDHGMSQTEKLIDNNQLHAAIIRGGWTYQPLNDKITKPNAAADFFFIPLGNMNCYFNRPFSEEERMRLFNTIRSVEGVGNIFTETALRRMQAHPNAGDFIVEPLPGYWFGGAGGVHGRMTESDAFLTLTGAGIKPGAVVLGAETVDIVPTLLHLMKLPIPPTVDGKVLRDSLD